MAKLIFSAICSLDGFINDANGDFEWAAPDEELHARANELQRAVGTSLYGRRMYEIMKFWDDVPGLDSEPQVVRDFAQAWADADKHVFSTTLESVDTAGTQVHRTFDPAFVERLKREAAADISIGGPTLAASALQAGLVDEIYLFMHPVLVGDGTPALQAGGLQQLTLVGQRSFASGVVELHYRA